MFLGGGGGGQNFYMVCMLITCTPYVHEYVGLRNDHKTVMKLIEEKLHQLHAEAKEKKKLQSQQKGEGGAGEAIEGGRAEESKAPPLRGFAKVNVVTDGSPAALAVSTIEFQTDVIIDVASSPFHSMFKLHAPISKYVPYICSFRTCACTTLITNEN